MCPYWLPELSQLCKDQPQHPNATANDADLADSIRYSVALVNLGDLSVSVVQTARRRLKAEVVGPLT